MVVLHFWDPPFMVLNFLVLDFTEQFLIVLYFRDPILGCGSVEMQVSMDP